MLVMMLCIGASYANAQVRVGGTGGHKSYAVSVGIKAGGSYNSIAEPSDFNVGLKGGFGYGGGVALNAHFGRKTPSSPGGTGLIGVQVEGEYVSKSFSAENILLGVSGVDVPLLLQIYALPALCFEVGPTFEFYGMKSEADISSRGARVTVNGQGGVNTMLTAGVGVHLSNGFTADLRYNYGLSALSQGWPAKISTISLGIGWMFKVIK